MCLRATLSAFERVARPRLTAIPALIVLAAAGGALPAAAQDVELLGEVYGTRPPDGYYRQLAEDPGSFRFASEGIARLERLRDALAGTARPDLPGTALALGPRSQPIVGTFRFPVVLGLFAAETGPPLYSRAHVQSEFFDGPNSYFQTIPEFYAELSGGLFQLQGTTYDWVQTALTRMEVTQNQSALVSHPTLGIGAFIEAIVRAVDATGVDWSRYDADDDGFVDLLTVVHPGQGAECAQGGTDRIWSHRWSLQSATEGRLTPGLATSTPRPNGSGFIYVNDYTVQPVLACDSEAINQIGTFAHELGHGLGLPDLYPTGGQSHRGTGNWDLMGTGSWGCRGTDAARPCHMGAWSKAVLGWLEVEEVGSNVDMIVTLPPVESSHRVLRVPSQDGSAEYLLLENRQALGSDAHIAEPGLLVWHVAPAVLDARWASNDVNVNPAQLGVALRQADGRNQLASPGGNRGDPGDPFPGCIKDDYFSIEPCTLNHEFHAGREPVSRTQAGAAMGITLSDIEAVGAAPADMRFRLHTGFTTVALSAEWEQAPLAVPPFRVNGNEIGENMTFTAAPFETRQIEAPPGLPLGYRTRAPFHEWSDGGFQTRSFVIPLADTSLVARYGGLELQIGVSLNDPAGGVSPGAVVSAPASEGFWFPEGTTISLEARPRTGFSFREWTGAIAGTENPRTLIVGPALELLARFDLSYSIAGVGGRVALEAAAPGEVSFQALNANAPVTWLVETGTLPAGLLLDPTSGRLLGGAMATGEFPIGVLARDAIGLEARGTVVLDIAPPHLGVSTLASPFLGTGSGPSELQKAFLDRAGNRNGSYDIGDFRAFRLAHQELPESAPVTTMTRAIIPIDGFAAPSEDGHE